MHPIYTMIPERSWRAVMSAAGRQDDSTRPLSLSMVMAALAVDPDEAADMAEAGRLPFLKTNFDTFARDGRIVPMLQTIAQWTMQQADAGDAVEVIMRWNAKLGVWCACKVAREALPMVPARMSSPLRLLDALEAWVVGRASHDQIVSVYSEVRLDQEIFYNPLQYAAEDAISAALAVAIAMLDDDYSAMGAVFSFVARARLDPTPDDNSPQWERLRNREMTRLRAVVAEACMTFPVRASSGWIRGLRMAPAAMGAVLGAGTMALAQRLRASSMRRG